MTEVLETEILQTKLSEEVTMQEALNLIDRGLSDASDRHLYRRLSSQTCC